VAMCRKVHEGHIAKILELMCKFMDEVPEYLDVLYAMVRVEGLDTPLRRNQSLVMKYVMRSFAQIAVDFSKDRDVRYVSSLHQKYKKTAVYPSVNGIMY